MVYGGKKINFKRPVWVKQKLQFSFYLFKKQIRAENMRNKKKVSLQGK